MDLGRAGEDALELRREDRGQLHQGLRARDGYRAFDGRRSERGEERGGPPRPVGVAAPMLRHEESGEPALVPGLDHLPAEIGPQALLLRSRRLVGNGNRHRRSRAIAFPGPTDIVKKALWTGLIVLAGGVSSATAAPDERVYPSHLMVDQEVTVAARITGIIETVQVDRGTAVTPGQVLATIEPREYDAAVRQAKEDMDLRKLEYDRAE